jgi:long-chain acyl-CoA synthetase
MMMIGSHLTSLNFKSLYFRKKQYDRKAINDAIDCLAQYLITNNISASPFILLAAYSHIKTVIAYYAILKAGKIPALMDPGNRSIELTEMIEDIDPAAIIVMNSEETTFCFEEEIIFRKTSPGFILSSDLTDVVTLAFTNAEDGYSKAAMLTEKNLMTEICALITTNRLCKNSVTCALLPFSHLYGLVQGVLVPTHAGSTGVIIELDMLKITEIAGDLLRYKVTHLYTVPSLYYLFSKVPGIDHVVKDVQEFYSGGTQLSSFIYNCFYQKTRRKIREGYGMTESSPGVALDYSEEEPVESSIGKAMPGCEIRILDENGKECAPDQKGEICIKGDMVFKGYLNHDDASARILENGWLHSGDYGKMDLHGNIYFCGLIKEMINVAGNNVYPRKLERMLKINKSVDDVKIFQQDSVLQGQVVGASVKLHENSYEMQDTFKKWCFENINNILLPKIWLFE